MLSSIIRVIFYPKVQLHLPLCGLFFFFVGKIESFQKESTQSRISCEDESWSDGFKVQMVAWFDLTLDIFVHGISQTF